MTQSGLQAIIVGYIFEQHMSDIEHFKAALSGKQVGNEISRRKKEGIFYTPEFAACYLVERVIGQFLAEHPDKLGTIKILDPACGDGALLYQAYSYLMNQYKPHEQQKLVEKTETQQLDFTDEHREEQSRTILLNNLFGIDINQESVEITKHSLWLKTARAYEPSQNLDKNIKDGNSLIADSAIASNAFSWQVEFQEILANGGFDIIIGNPPYISSMQLTKTVGEEVKKYWKQTYVSAKGSYDMYILFFEQAIKLLKEDGYLGFITPNKFLSAPYGESIRNFIKEHCQIVEVFDLSGVKIFADPAVYPVITILKKSNKRPYNILARVSKDITLTNPKTTILPSEIVDALPHSMFSLITSKQPRLIEKIFASSRPLNSLAEVNATSTATEADELSNYINEVAENGKKVVNTGTIDRYIPLWGIHEMQNKGQKYLKPYLDTQRLSLSQHRQTIYNAPKILFAKMAKRIEAFLDDKGEFASLNTNCIYNVRPDIPMEFLLGVLNSKLMSFIYTECFGALKMSGGYLQFQAPQLRILPIIVGTTEQQEIIAKHVRALRELYAEREHAKVPFNTLKTCIVETENEIDQLVYELYRLSNDETH